MAKRLRRYVYLEDPNTHRTVRFGPKDTLPDWAVKAITNPSAWAADGGGDVEDDPELDRYDELRKMKVPELEKLADELAVDRTGITRKGPLIDAIIGREEELAKNGGGGG